MSLIDWFHGIITVIVNVTSSARNRWNDDEVKEVSVNRVCGIMNGDWIKWR